jgi:hypothetical protein
MLKPDGMALDYGLDTIQATLEHALLWEVEWLSIMMT